MKKSILGVLMFTVALVIASPAVGDVWYVDGGIGTSGDGTSWATAFLTIQEAIDAASAGHEVWVKAGTYPLSATINVDEEVSLYGGFYGDETERSQRDWETNVTTIDGNNAVRCLFVTGDNVTIDGFVVTRGNAGTNNSGGGILSGVAGVAEIHTTVANCSFIQNQAGKHGGGSHNDEGDLTILNCIFQENVAVSKGGGASSNASGNPVSISDSQFIQNQASNGGALNFGQNCGLVSLTGCDFDGNIATGTGSNDGGAIICDAAIDVTACSFVGNSALRNGTIVGRGAVGKPISLVNCLFASNTVQHGGIIALNGNQVLGALTITHCTSSGNTASVGAGAVYNTDTLDGSSQFTVTNSILWGDSPDEIGGTGGLPTVSYSDVDQDGYAGSNGNIREDPVFASVDDLHLAEGSPCVDTATDAGVTDDIDGDSRPLLSGFDMGADEYSGPCWDLDGDTYTSDQCGGDDCDDSNPDVHPGAVEECGQATCSDGLDNDCDGVADAADPDCEEWCAQGAQASTIQAAPASTHDRVGALAVFLVPLAGILLLKTARRRRR